ncbi:Cytochrome c oxidase subunit 7 [Yamadazyma tenuis]|uniref:Cytochrome c oxidase polypeptide n=1 Tax=Candida tenuis (strain ATCC 10573 / BCRC 21748 / CBS 615 / JCM 9827 / NBRC 10315 / NRRL Y-1498 / VKM Y-70) TaxID=590646 RepID=G3B3T2_CANTC|nr:cytochrome c oxidase polypeptide [Yamadazyma tenuis ATCC 10573]EGV63725.1 cytochrome c oxidase polypeptide [Yamadazyma tenuis ATCC 10573]WEJ96664.1 Cytochrome c oxidase subunit 7 [Yamadazyma tenuis]
MAPDPQRIIKLQQRYQTTHKPLWLRGSNSRMLVYPYYALFTVGTVVSLYYSVRGVLGIKPE